MEPNMAEAFIFAGVAGYVGRPDATGAVGVFRRASKGGEWSHVFGDHPAHTVYVHPDYPSIVYAGTTNGVWCSTDSGASFQKADFPDADKQIWSFLAIDGKKYPGLVHVKKLIKTLEIIAEEEQTRIIAEQKELEAKKGAEEYKEGSPGKKELEDVLKQDGTRKSASATLGGNLSIGGEMSFPKSAPKDSGKARAMLSPQMQLNTIEEDMHETQTSNVSYAQAGEPSVGMIQSERDLSQSAIVSASQNLYQSQDLAVSNDLDQ